FENGRSANVAPEQSLAYFMGIWGGALSVGLADIVERVPLGNDQLSNLILKPMIHEMKKMLPRDRIIRGTYVPNFVYKLSAAPAYAQSQQYLDLIDAGFSGSG